MMLLRTGWALLLLCVTAPSFALEIDLPTALRLALESNLALRAQILNTGAAEEVRAGGYGVYDPRLQAGIRSSEVRDRVNLQFFGAKTQTKTRTLSLSLIQTLPTGAEVFLEAGTERSTANPPLGIDPAYDSLWQVGLTQPLWRGFGRTVTEQRLLFAVEDQRISFQDLRDQAFTLLSQVERTYFEILSLRDNLQYRQASVDVARRLLKDTAAKVKAGALPPVEELQAEVGLQLRERERLEAERLYRDALDRLAVLLNATDSVEVVGVLGEPQLAPDEEAGVASALQKRPDLGRIRAELDRLQLDQRLAHDRLFPRLDLEASYGHAGLARRFSNSFDDLAGDDLRRWEIGLSLSTPLGNRTARHDFERARLLRQSAQAQLSQLQVEVRRQVRAAIRLFEVSRKKIVATRLGSQLAEEELRLMLKRHEVGLATTRQVLESEKDLAESRTLYSEALAEYNVAVKDYYFTTGQLLEHEGVHFVRDGHLLPVLD